MKRLFAVISLCLIPALTLAQNNYHDPEYLKVPSVSTYSQTVTGDLDQDGDTDLVAFGASVFLFRNLGDGTFETDSSGNTLPERIFQLNIGDGYIQSGALEDVNGDGVKDIIASTSGQTAGTRNIYLLLNTGAGRFWGPIKLETGLSQSTNSFSAASVVTADFNGDGFVDIAAGFSFLGKTVVFLNGGTAGVAPFLPAVTYDTPVGGAGLSVIRNYPEETLSIISSNQNGPISNILVGSADGSFTVEELVVGSKTRDTASLDLGYYNFMLFTSAERSELLIAVRIANALYGPFPFGANFGASIKDVQTTDVDGDQLPDILLSQPWVGTGVDRVIVMTSSQGYAREELTFKDTYQFCSGDLNGDGKQDIVAGSWNGTSGPINRDVLGIAFSASN